jgi:hypothetical protein
MNNWQPIETYQKPIKEFDIDFPKALFYSRETGIVVGRCYLTDEEDGEYSFQHGDGFSFEPTHWMPLPEEPEEEIEETLCPFCKEGFLTTCSRCGKIGCDVCTLGFDSLGRYCCTECLVKTGDLETVYMPKK